MGNCASWCRRELVLVDVPSQPTRPVRTQARAVVTERATPPASREASAEVPEAEVVVMGVPQEEPSHLKQLRAAYAAVPEDKRKPLVDPTAAAAREQAKERDKHNREMQEFLDWFNDKVKTFTRDGLVQCDVRFMSRLVIVTDPGHEKEYLYDVDKHFARHKIRTEFTEPWYTFVQSKNDTDWFTFDWSKAVGAAGDKLVEAKEAEVKEVAVA